jgi:hypothetical protein
MQTLDNQIENSMRELARNLDYSLRLNKAKRVLVVSDRRAEGKSFFIKECVPYMAELYQKKILVLDLGLSHDENLKEDLAAKDPIESEIVETAYPDVDYVSIENLKFLEVADAGEKEKRLDHYVSQLMKFYDNIFINTNTKRNVGATVLPNLLVDGAVIIRSKKSVYHPVKKITDELLDREIPIVGIIDNEGAQ